MEQTKALAALDLFATSRAGIDVASDQIIEGIRSGEVNPLTGLAWCKTMEEIIERVRKETRDNQLREADKHPGKTFDFVGAKFTKFEAGTRYDYAGCGDTEWERLHADAETAKSRLSDRESFLKAIKEPISVNDSVTGEVVTIRPPVKTSVSTISVTIK
jgi:hypothetical protein